MTFVRLNEIVKKLLFCSGRVYQRMGRFLHHFVLIATVIELFGWLLDISLYESLFTPQYTTATIQETKKILYENVMYGFVRLNIRIAGVVEFNSKNTENKHFHFLLNAFFVSLLRKIDII